jgi:hypothetical protein
MTTATPRSTPTLSPAESRQVTAGTYRPEHRPVLPVFATAKNGSRRPRHAPHTEHGDRAGAGAQGAQPGSAAGDPTAPRTPVSVMVALAETHRHVGRSAGPDRTADIARLRAEIAEAADVIHGLALAEYYLTRDPEAVAGRADEIDRTSASLRQERERLQRARDALEAAEAAQRRRDEWLDAHPEIVAHLDELSARARRLAGRRPGRHSAGRGPQLARTPRH